MYSTVGVLVPICLLRMLLKIWATSFLPWQKHKQFNTVFRSTIQIGITHYHLMHSYHCEFCTSVSLCSPILVGLNTTSVLYTHLKYVKVL